MIRRQSVLPEPLRAPLGKLLAFIVGATLLVLGFIFSVVLLAVAAAVGLCVWIYLWWKTRELRRVLNEQQPVRAAAPEATEGLVVEGEAIIVEEHDSSFPHGRQ